MCSCNICKGECICIGCGHYEECEDKHKCDPRRIEPIELKDKEEEYA